MKTPWFEREFPRVEIERLPCLVERLRGTPVRLEERIGAADRGRLVQRPAGLPSSWSAQENAGHLLDLEPLWFGRVQDFRSGRETLRPADLENKATHAAGHNEADPATLLRGFRQARAELVSSLQSLDEELTRRTALHPRLQQPMTVADLAFFVAEHDDHHLATITELLAR